MRKVWEPHGRHGCSPDVSVQEAAASWAGGAQEEECPGLLGPQGSCRPLQSPPAAVHTQNFLQGPCPTSACSRTGLLSFPLRAGVSRQRALRAHGGRGKSWGAGVGCGRRETCPPEPRAQPPDAEGPWRSGREARDVAPRGQGWLWWGHPLGRQGQCWKEAAGAGAWEGLRPSPESHDRLCTQCGSHGGAGHGWPFLPTSRGLGRAGHPAAWWGWTGCSAGWRGMPANEAGFPSRGRLGKADSSLTV